MRHFFCVVASAGLFLWIAGEGSAADKAFAIPENETSINLTLVLTPSRSRENIFLSPRSVSIVSRAALEEQAPRTLPEALEEIPGVTIQQTTHGHGVPIIRGFIGRQNLILVDGLRLNNSIFRSGPNQYLNTIDQYTVDQVEVVRGPGSVLYGSDAMGGVVNVLTRKRKDFSSPCAVRRRLAGTYSGADDGLQGRLEIEGNSSNFGFLAGASLKNFGDLRAGGTYGTEKPTGYAEKDFNAAVNYRISDSGEVTLAHQNVNQENVPRYDKYTTARSFKTQTNQLYIYDPQHRSMTYLSYDDKPGIPGMEEVNVKAVFQRQKEGRKEQKAGSATRSDSRDIADTAGMTFQASSSLGSVQRLVYGVDYYEDRVYSAKDSVNTLTGAITPKPLESAFPNGSEYTTFGVFLQDRLAMTDILSMTIGGRYSAARLDSFYRTPLSGAYRDQFDALTGSIGMDCLMSPSHTLFINVSEAFRAPNLDDTVGILTTNLGLNMPHYGLKPEKSITYEAGIKRQGKLSGSLAVYMTDLRDLIITKTGLGFYDANANGIKDLDEYDIRQQVNAGEGIIQGAEMAADYAVSWDWKLYGTLAWTYGENTSDNEPISRIPPLNGTFGCRWRPSYAYWAGVYTAFADKQDRLSASDKADSRIPPGGTPGWVTLNLQGGIELGDSVTVAASLNNITDAPYRIHGSGVDAPGRSIAVTVSSVF